MTRARFMALPLLIVVIATAYWFLSYEAAGTVMLIVFGMAMAVLGFVLLPTLPNVGHTAPIVSAEAGEARDDLVEH